MSTVELIEEKAKSLPGDLQVEALHYVEFLLTRMQARTESGEWAKFSAAQLEKQYNPADAIYDRDQVMRQRHPPGEILLAALVFTSQAGAKKRPVMVIRDAGDDDILVAPVSSQAVRVVYDVSLNDWQRAGLRLPSVVRVEKLATIEVSTVLRSLGRASAADWARIRESLTQLCGEILRG